MSKIFKDFYGEKDTLEVCVILFDRCNLNCDFCFEEHTHMASSQDILDITKNLLIQLDETIIKRPYLKNFTFRFWGGEVFGDFVPDEYFETYQTMLDMIRDWSKIHNYSVDFCFSTNLVFFRIDEVKQFIENNKEDTFIATSYDPVSRFKTKMLEDLWWRNLEIFNPKVISITLTKPAIEKYISTDILSKLSKYELYPEYYIYNKDWKIYAPSSEELFDFFKCCYENKINLPELNSIIDNYKTKSNNRYCYCYNSCSFINNKLTFSCLLRSGTMEMLSEYGMTLEECYDNDNVTEKQFNIATNRLNCLNCKYYQFCRLPCMASKMHKDSKSGCHLKLFYDWLESISL